MEIKEILKEKREHEVVAQGWIIYLRGNKKILFLTINDGSTFANLQVVVKDIKQFDEVSKLRMGAAIKVKGQIKLTPDAQQPLELVATDVVQMTNCDEDFPLVKQEMTLEVLRLVPYLRHRTHLFRAVMMVRSTISRAIHDFFEKENFTLISSPIITSNDGEGAGESFYVSDNSKTPFFGRPVTLGVTGQLHAEALAMGMGKVYTFAPTFRAEKSHTKRHAAEFWMIEPEAAFFDLNMIIDLAHRMIVHTFKVVLSKNSEELDYLGKYNNIDLKSRMNEVIHSDVKKVEYKEAISILEKAVKQDGNKFENSKIFFGQDLATEHERYLTDEYFKRPVAVYNYPKEIKAFYMYQNSDHKTVASFDFLVPGVGEMIGGSQREDRYEKLVVRMNELKMSIEEYKWYVDLRRFGYPGSAGFGLGLERMIMYITGMDNIRDVMSFPRNPNSIIG